MLKKYGISLLFLLAINISHAMDVVKLKDNLSVEQDYKCYWVARYVSKAILTEKEEEQFLYFVDQGSLLSSRVLAYRGLMKDVENETEEFLKNLKEKKTDEAYDDYFKLLGGAQYQVAFCLRASPIARVLGDGVVVISKDTVNDMLALKCGHVSDVKIEGKIKGNEICDLDSFILKRRKPNHVPQPSPLQRSFKDLTVKELLNLMQQQAFTLKFTKNPHWNGGGQDIEVIPSVEFIIAVNENESLEILRKICAGSSSLGIKDVPHNCRLFKEEQDNLKQLHFQVSDLIEWKTLQQALIGIDFPQPTRWQRCKDRMLLAMPLCLIQVVIPQLMYNCMSGKVLPVYIAGKTTGTLGALFCGISSGIVGAKVFPFLDQYNSGVSQLRATFGEQGVERIIQSLAFFWHSILHYSAVALGGWCLGAGGPVMPVIGMTIYGLRVLALLYGILSTKHYFGNCNSFGKMAFAYPGLRRNKQHCRFTLKDLVELS